MTRLEANRRLLEYLSNVIEKNPQYRFIQALWACKFINFTDFIEKDIEDRFHEESATTLETSGYTAPEDEDYNETFLCECGNVEHMLLFSHIKDGGTFLQIHLTKLPFWSRLKNGIKYIFGHTSKYGDFDEIILRSEDAERFQKVVNSMRRGKN